MESKLFTSVKYTFHWIYSNTSPSTNHNLPNSLFQHTSVWFMPTYPFFYSTTILSCAENYVTTLFKYRYHFNLSKLFPSVNYTFHWIYSNTSPSTKHNLTNNLFQHILGVFMSTYTFHSSKGISPCPKVFFYYYVYFYIYRFNFLKTAV